MTKHYIEEKGTDMRIGDIMTKSIEYVDPLTTLESVARTMRDTDVGGLPVLDDGKMIGFLADRDIVTRAIAEGHAPGATTARDAMTADVFCLNEDQSVENAIELMTEHQIRRVVVVDRNKLPVGMITLGDLAQKSTMDSVPARVLQAVSQDTPADRPYC